MKLQEIKDNYAKEQGYSDYEDFELNAAYHECHEAIDQIAKEYAKAKLEEAAERAEVKKVITEGKKLTYTSYVVDKHSITNTPLD